MRPNEIKIHPVISKLFSIQPELLDTITMSMKEGTYDFSQPVVVAILEGHKDPICIDGHTRLRAAINAGIEQIPVFTHEDFKEDEAIEEAIRLQRDRRNISDEGLVSCIAALDQKYTPGRPRKELAPDGANFSGDGNSTDSNTLLGSASDKTKGKSAAGLAKMLGTSQRKVERARTSLEHGDPVMVEKMKDGEVSVNMVYEQTQAKRRKAKSDKKIEEDKVQPFKNEAPFSRDEPVEAETGSEPVTETAAPEVGPKSVIVNNILYEELKKLGGSITHHVAKAITMYLKSLCETEIAASHEHAA